MKHESMNYLAAKLTNLLYFHSAKKLVQFPLLQVNLPVPFSKNELLHQCMINIIGLVLNSGQPLKLTISVTLNAKIVGCISILQPKYY